MKSMLNQSLARLEQLDCTEQDYKKALAALSDRELAKVERLDDIPALSEAEANELDSILGRVHDFLVGAGHRAAC
ncbi:hypothetical protein Mmc1_2470 [Magnetococcus marinus MC-1]|uniref:Uncharacterized protein n=1 Tax=Magnetococcus marinus (strain ATCC BAA-1437 / JCM 17883 / MC-1) TaxID=156889 RepID=A0LAH7_MAGMM|nr:hypothetical protein [Magnetococcus marinus]ABK44970.1 hypothetical protein Mmc1_2470 [Magnetococcus marinus MC-1]